MAESTFEQKYEAALQIITRLVENGYIAYFAGGYVRDRIMGNEQNSDIDIATNATPLILTKLFSQTIGVGEQFGVIIVVQGSIPFEVATFRSDVGIKDGRHPADIVFTDAKTDAERRDFTINGMFYDPLVDNVIDYVSGQEDIKARIIRAIGDPNLRFREDYLRMLRAVRFAARFEFTIEQSTWSAIIENGPGIKNVSTERIYSEVDKMLRQPHPDSALFILQETGLLPLVLPEVSGLAGIAQPPEFHPEGDVFTHVIKTLSFLPSDTSPILAWSALLHDIGKPSTMTVTDRIRFHNHHHTGAIIAVDILKRLRAPNALIEGVAACVENHMNFMNVTRMRLSTLKKFLSRPTIHDELELHRVDCLASHGNIDNYYFIKERLANMAQEQIKPLPLIGGKDLIDLGFKPGPLFGKILGEVYDLQLEEKVSTRDAAIAVVKEMYNIEG